MSWSSGARRGALLAALLALAGCGFHPLYGNTTGAVPVNVQQQLESIRIVPSPDRMGQRLYNDLRDMLNPRGVPAKPNYVLAVQLVESQQQLLLEQDQAATRTYLLITANYHLKVADGQAEVLSGTVRTRTGFNLLTNEYASLVAQQNAEERAAAELADSIRQRLALYLAQAPAPPPAKPGS
jgi:LPS-assembly lipoprotein